MPKAILQSLILADHVYEDKITGKKIVAGIFSRIRRGKRVTRPVPAKPSAPEQPRANGGGQGVGGSGGGENQPNQRILEIPASGMQAGSPFAYLSMTEVRGANIFQLQFVNLEDRVPLFHSEIKVECHDPLQTIELVLPLPPLAPPQAGVFALELLQNNEILGSLRIIVEEEA